MTESPACPTPATSSTSARHDHRLQFSDEFVLDPLALELAGLAWDVVLFDTPLPPPVAACQDNSWRAMRRRGVPQLPRLDPADADVRLLRVRHGQRTWYVTACQLVASEQDRVGALRQSGWVSWPEATACATGWRPTAKAEQRAIWQRECRELSHERAAMTRTATTLSGPARVQAMRAAFKVSGTYVQARTWRGPIGELLLTRTLGATRLALPRLLHEVLGEQRREPVARLGHLRCEEVESRPGAMRAQQGQARQIGQELARCRACGQPLRDPVSAARGWGPDCWQEQLRRHPALRTQLEPVPLTQRRLAQVLQATFALLLDHRTAWPRQGAGSPECSFSECAPWHRTLQTEGA